MVERAPFLSLPHTEVGLELTPASRKRSERLPGPVRTDDEGSRQANAKKKNAKQNPKRRWHDLNVRGRSHIMSKSSG